MPRTIPAPSTDNQFPSPSIDGTPAGNGSSNRIIKAPVSATEPDTDSEENSFLSAWNSIKSFGQGVRQAVTGEGVELEFPDVKELTEIDSDSVGFWESFPVNIKLGSVRDNAKKAEVLKNHWRGDKRFGGIYTDKFGHPMVVWNDKPYYLNKPGLTGQDWNTFAGEIMKYLPAGRFVSKAKTAKGTIGRGVPAYTATEIGGQALEGTLAPETTAAQKKTLTERGTEALKMGALSAGIEAAIPPVARGIARGVKGAVAPATAFFAPHISKYARVMKESFQDLGEELGGVGPVVSKSKYELTQGQRGAKPPAGVTPAVTRQLEQEDVFRQSPAASDEAASGVIRRFDDAQLAAIRKDALEIQNEFGSGTIDAARAADGDASSVVSTSAERAQDVVSGVVDKLKTTSSAAYKAARDDPYAAVMTPKGVFDTVNRMRDKVFGKSEGSMGLATGELSDMPLLVRELDFLGRVQKTFAKRAGEGFTTAGSRDVPLTQLHAYQKRLNRAIKQAGPGQPEGVALAAMKRELDESIYRGLDEGFMAGDEAVITQLRNATGLYRDYLRLSGKGAASTSPRRRANKILEKLADKDYTAQELAGALFGHAKFNPNQSMRMVIDDFKRLLPEDQYDEVMSYLKDAVLEKAFTNSQGSITRSNIVKNYNDIFIKNKQIAEAIFSPEEIARITQFRKDVFPTMWAEMKLNPSGSGYVALGGLARAGLMSTSLKVLASTPVVEKAGQTLAGIPAKSFAKEAVRQYLRKNQMRWLTFPSSASLRTVAPTGDDAPATVKNIVKGLTPSAREKLLESVR